jgi:hypothetical protein
MDLKVKIFKRLIREGNWDTSLENEINQWSAENVNAQIKETASHIVPNEKIGDCALIVLLWYSTEKKNKIGI